MPLAAPPGRLDGSRDLAIVDYGPSYPTTAPGTVTLMINRIGE